MQVFILIFITSFWFIIYLVSRAIEDILAATVSAEVRVKTLQKLSYVNAMMGRGGEEKGKRRSFGCICIGQNEFR